MKNRGLKVSAIILAIGLVLSLVACLVANMILEPTVTEQEFNYSITYKLCGETKTLEGVYTCKYNDYNGSQTPWDRYYTGTYTEDGQTTASHTRTIAQKDGAELYIVMSLNGSYLMGDRNDPDYEPFLEEPYLGALDKDGYPYEEGEMPSEFTAEIISWEYPEPIENTFTFSGFSTLHAGSMLAMLAVGLLTILACIIFVKKDETISGNALDRVSVLINCAVCFAAIPFITSCTIFMQLTMGSMDLLYQVFLCIPALTAFTVAASIALRRNGFAKTGFFIQFVGPVLFFVPLVVEEIINNLFG